MVDNGDHYNIGDIDGGGTLDPFISGAPTFYNGTDTFYGCYYESEKKVHGEPAFYPGIYGSTVTSVITVTHVRAVTFLLCECTLDADGARSPLVCCPLIV